MIPLHDIMTLYQQTFTLTFGDFTECRRTVINHTSRRGISIDELEGAEQSFKSAGCTTELHRLSNLLPETVPLTNALKEAGVLIVRDGIRALGVDPNQLYDEQRCLPFDRHGLMRGRIVNKHARYNLSYATQALEPNYPAGKGRTVAFATVPLTSALRDALQGLFEFYEDTPLLVEGNQYIDPSRCGIGYHGDSERRIAIGARLGHTMPLCFRWYHRSKVVSELLTLTLNHGDIYFMTEKACGADWRRHSLYTLRHAAGAEKYIK